MEIVELTESVANSLEAVYRQFEIWRKARKHGARIPSELWELALGLVGKYSPMETSLPV